MQPATPLRFALLPVIALVAVGTGYLIVDAAGAFPMVAGPAPPGYGLVALGVIGVIGAALLTPFVLRDDPLLGWTLAPGCAAFFATWDLSFDHGADGYVPRFGDEHPGLATWAVALGAAGLVTGALAFRWPRVGLSLTPLVAIGCLLPMTLVGLGGH
jgi:hypothetical protein